MYETISILGSTGSIGTQTLKVAKSLGIKVTALTTNSNISLLEQQIREFSPEKVAVMNQDAAHDLKVRVSDTDTVVLAGVDGICEVASTTNSQVVLNALVGIAGLIPTLRAIEAGKDIALANKETLVAGGALVMSAAKEMGVKILPVDSEHSAIFQCLQGNGSEIKRIILTASGGPFFGKTKDQLRHITPAEALRHPNWSMGAKISIDSATMMNKGLELIEAVWLFSVEPSKIDIIVHRESIIHSLVEFTDNSVIAQLGIPDMMIPIQYALTYPQRYPCSVPSLDLTELGTLSFYKPDYDTFDCMTACRKAIEKGGPYPTAVNGANEAAVELFLSGKLSFLQISELVFEAMNINYIKGKDNKNISLDDIIETDKAAKEFVLSRAK